MDWKARLTHPAFWTGMVSAVVLLTQQLGFNVFPENISDIVNTILVIGTMLGIIVDPTTQGVKDLPLLTQKKEDEISK